MSLTATLQPDAAIFCSVVNHPADLTEALAEHTRLVVLNSNTNLPFMNAYQSPSTLGADRLALVAGAQALYPQENSLAISIGTAITYNFLQNGRIFRGGNITPGVSLRASLAERTY